jgi:hypothetical protein
MSTLLVEKGLATPSMLGSEAQLYWESEQKTLPGALPRRKIVLTERPIIVTERRTRAFGRRASDRPQ